VAETFRLEFEGSVDQWVADLLPELFEAQKSGLLLAAQAASIPVRNRIFEAFPGGRGGLARSYTATLLQPKDGKLRSGVTSDSVYARIQNEGGTIVPKSAKALTIPISNEAKRAGEEGRGARDLGMKLSLIWHKGDPTGLLAESIKGKLKPHYLLAKRSTIKGRHYLEKAAEDAEPKIAEIMDASLQKAGDESKAGGE
jgi:hypothetical protein